MSIENSIYKREIRRDGKDMNSETHELGIEDKSLNKRQRWGNSLNRFSAIVLALSSLFKFSQLPGPIAYMGSLGYTNGTYFFIAGLELLVALLFWIRSTRPLGLLLVSSYLGGAISAHLASGHPSLARGPEMAYMLRHPLAGVIPACLVLACAWIGTWLEHPEMLFANRSVRPNKVAVAHQSHQIPLPSRS